MATYGLPLLFVVVAWFVATGIVIALDRLPRATFRWSLGVAGVVALAAVYGTARIAADASPRGAYLGFAAALAIWGWHEMSFLMGVVTGPRRSPCPPAAAGWTRFRLAAATLIWHEIALAVTAAGLLALTWGEPNQLAAITFATLFVMRLSTKFNIFLGVPNLTLDFVPAHLAYLTSYFRVRTYNPLFPVSVAATSVAALLLGEAALAAATPGRATALTIIFALVALAVLEHWFLVLPLPDAALWRWALPSRSPATNKKTIGVLP